MPWFKVDDSLGFHGKVVAAGNAAMGLWVRAGAWSAQTLTEGFIPDHMISALSGTKSAPTLVQVRLWKRVEGGYAFLDWGDYQPSRASVEADRQAAKLRQRKARDKAKQRRDSSQSQSDEDDPSRGSHGVSHAVTRALVTVPPTRPDPTHKEKTSASADAERDFEEWWKVYPRKRDKGHALKAYRAARRKTTAEALLVALNEQRDKLAADGDFAPYGATWLNGERWADEDETGAEDRPWWA